MPIYEYTCDDCSCRFEMLRPMKDADNPANCPECGGQQTSRALSLFCAHGESGVVTGSSSSCSSCSGGSCSGCGS